MKYKKAQDVLPQYMIEDLQKYIEGSRAIEFTIGLAAIMALWMGIMNIAKDSGLIDMIGQKMDFILKRLFPKIPKNHKAMSLIVSISFIDNSLEITTLSTPCSCQKLAVS